MAEQPDLSRALVNRVVIGLGFGAVALCGLLVDRQVSRALDNQDRIDERQNEMRIEQTKMGKDVEQLVKQFEQLRTCCDKRTP